MTEISNGSAFTTTVIPYAGYTVSSVFVTMGGVSIDAYNAETGKIEIANVTGDVVITATAVCPDSDEPYYPPTTVVDNSSKDDDKTTVIIACAAAAAAAALAMLFFLVDSRRP